MMKGGSAIYCPGCNNRQVVGVAGQKVELPTAVTCSKCGGTISIAKSESTGVHVTLQSAGATH